MVAVLYVAERQIGESEHDLSMLESHEPGEETGLYLLPEPVPFNGTLVAVNASGYCINSATSNLSVMLCLTVYRPTGIGMKYEQTETSIMFGVDCDHSTGDYTYSSVERTLEVKVQRDHYLGVKFHKRKKCSFQPATLNSTDSWFFSRPKPEKVIAINETRIMQNVSLQLSVIITSGKVYYSYNVVGGEYRIKDMGGALEIRVVWE